MPFRHLLLVFLPCVLLILIASLASVTNGDQFVILTLGFLILLLVAVIVLVKLVLKRAWFGALLSAAINTLAVYNYFPLVKLSHILGFYILCIGHVITHPSLYISCKNDARQIGKLGYYNHCHGFNRIIEYISISYDTTGQLQIPFARRTKEFINVNPEDGVGINNYEVYPLVGNYRITVSTVAYAY